MKIYIVNVTSWNGEEDVTTVYCVKSTEEAAMNFCNMMNEKRNSPYSSSYDYDEFDVED